jgi:hypothetical protein
MNITKSMQKNIKFGVRFQVSGFRNDYQMAVASFDLISAGYGGLLRRSAMVEY